MLDLDRVNTTQKWGSRILWCAEVVWPVLGALLVFNEKMLAHYPALTEVIKTIKQQAIWGFIVYFGLLIVGKLLIRKGRTVCWKALQAQVDTLQQIACPEQAADLTDNHRVTLFRWQRFSWRPLLTHPKRWPQLLKKGKHPWSGWLKPVLRSGHTSKNTKTIFWAPDDSRQAEGMAGYCWATGRAERFDALPSLTKTSNNDNRQKYSERANMPIAMVDRYLDRDRPLPRSLLGMSVKTSRYKAWGVLVIDSQSPGGIDYAQADNAFMVIASPLSVMLEEL